MNKDEKIKLLEETVTAQIELLCCYRVGKRPTEKLLDTLSRCKKKLGL